MIYGCSVLRGLLFKQFLQPQPYDFQSSLQMKSCDFDREVQSMNQWMGDTEKLVNSLHVRMDPNEVTKRVQQIKVVYKKILRTVRLLFYFSKLKGFRIHTHIHDFCNCVYFYTFGYILDFGIQLERFNCISRSKKIYEILEIKILEHEGTCCRDMSLRHVAGKCSRDKIATISHTRKCGGDMFQGHVARTRPHV